MVMTSAWNRSLDCCLASVCNENSARLYFLLCTLKTLYCCWKCSHRLGHNHCCSLGEKRKGEGTHTDLLTMFVWIHPDSMKKILSISPAQSIVGSHDSGRKQQRLWESWSPYLSPAHHDRTVENYWPTITWESLRKQHSQKNHWNVREKVARNPRGYRTIQNTLPREVVPEEKIRKQPFFFRKTMYVW